MISLFEKAEKLISDVLFPTFVRKRYEAAKKIADTSEDRGKFAILSFYHFAAKLKPYLNAKRWEKKDTETRCDLFKERYKKAYAKLKNLDSLTQKEFQSLTGILEAYGEVYLQSKKPKDYSKE
jgi:hypothetical protein